MPLINFDSNTFILQISLTWRLRTLYPSLWREMRRHLLRGGALSSTIVLPFPHFWTPMNPLLTQVYSWNLSSQFVSVTAIIVPPSVSSAAGTQWVLWRHWKNGWRNGWGSRVELKRFPVGRTTVEQLALRIAGAQATGGVRPRSQSPHSRSQGGPHKGFPAF